MSSHHVVRDEQEPAVIVASPPRDFFPYLSEMFEWSPVVVVLEDALENFLAWDTKLDIVVGKANTIKNFEQQLYSQNPYKLIEAKGNQIECALEVLMKNNHKTAHIFLQESMPSNLQNFVGDNMELVFFTSEMKIVKSKASIFSKWVAKDTQFKMVEGEITSTKNLKQNGVIFEAIENGFVDFYGKHNFWVGEILRFSNK